LLDLTIDASKVGDGESPYAFAITYGNKDVNGDNGDIGTTLDLEEYESINADEITENTSLYQINGQASNANEKQR
jgi:hypothetical protein